MAALALYSGLDLRGLPLRGVGLPETGDDVVTRAYLESRLLELEQRLAAAQAQLAAVAARDQVVVSDTDPGGVRGLWVQTGVGPTGSDMTLWVRDGA